MKKLLAIGGILAAGIGFAYSQGSMGFWSNWPLFGQSYCAGYVNGVCTTTIPPGETSVTGGETVPMDTNLPGGQYPQSQKMSIDYFAHLGEGSERNFLRGADFYINLWQRGTTFSSLTPTTTTMTADGWGVYSSGNTVTISQDLTAGDLSPTLGINGAMKITRPTGTNTSAICVSQVLPQKDSVKFIGKEAVFSFYANPLTGFLSTNDDIIATLAVYTATDSATPGTNTDAFAKGTITGYTVIDPTSTTTTAAPSIPLATGWNRYSVSGAVPAQVTVSGTLTNVVGIGVQICTPVYPASTGVAGDGFLIANPQLEQTNPGTTGQIAGPTGTPSVTIPATLAGITPSGFTRRNTEAEWAYEYSFSYVLTDGAATRRYGLGQATTTALATLYAQYPVPMREIPTLTVGTTISFGVTEANGTATTCGTSIAAVGTSGTTDGSALTCTTGGTALVAGNAVQWIGANTGGTLTFSAEP